MPVYKHNIVSFPETKRFHFIHIPRTAGRFIDAVIVDNNFKLEHSTQAVSYTHLTLPTKA